MLIITVMLRKFLNFKKTQLKIENCVTYEKTCGMKDIIVVYF